MSKVRSNFLGSQPSVLIPQRYSLDLVFIGPNDLAQSLLGYVPARGDEPEFVAAIDKIAAAAKKHGKWSGRLVNNGGLAKDAKATFDTVAITGDTKAIQNWYIAELEVARST